MYHLTAPFDPATPLRDLIRLAVPVCRGAEPLLPPRGPGRPVEFPEWVVAVMILVAVAKRLRDQGCMGRTIAL